MKRGYCHILISATTRTEANKISDVLLGERLIAGALITKGSSRFWWRDRVVEEDYFNISAFSVMRNKRKIVSKVKQLHKDECPIIAFFEMTGNRELLAWIENSVI